VPAAAGQQQQQAAGQSSLDAHQDDLGGELLYTNLVLQKAVCLVV
jgi:hypothetical protein